LKTINICFFAFRAKDKEYVEQEAMYSKKKKDKKDKWVLRE